MLGRFNEYGKWKDYIAIRSFEFKFSAGTTIIIFLYLLLVLDVHNKFTNYVVPFQTFTSGILQALIGMLGIILAGLAIVISMLNNEMVKEIEKQVEKKEGKKHAISRILTSFEFLAFTISIWIFLILIINITLYSKDNLINGFLFYSIVVITLYFLSFIVFYTVALISNCVRIFYISNLSTVVTENEQTLFDRANEVRIDFIIKTISEDKKISGEEFLSELNKVIDSTYPESSEPLKKYFESYYGLNNSNSNTDDNDTK